MAQLLPDKEKQRPLAYMLLVVTAILVYWIGFHWFFQRHAELSEEMDQLRASEARFQGMIAQRERLEEELSRVRQFEADSDLFLKQASASLGSAELTNRLKELIRLHASEGEQNCQVISNQLMRGRVQEPFERVTNKVRLRCELEDLSKVLYHLENGTPYVFVDELSIYRHVTRRRRGRETVEQRTLDVRFDLSGYLKS